MDCIVYTTEGSVLSHERRYYVTSLDPSNVSLPDLFQLIRNHWQIENSLHFVKDRWWDEDRHYTRRPGLALAFASLTNAALSVLRLIDGKSSILRAKAERVQWNPSDILESLGFGLF